MKRVLAVLLLSLIATAAFAHAGHHHKYLGTVKSLKGDALLVHTTTGQDVGITLATTTAVTRDGAPAARTELTEGARVSVELGNDGRTAVSVKLGHR